MKSIIIFIIGFTLGLLAYYIIDLRRKKEEEQRMKDSFKALTVEAWKDMIPFVNEALSKQLSGGEKDLENKKQLIDQTLGNMKTDLLKVENLMNTLEKDRENKFGELTTQIKQTAEQTGKLRESTDKLNIALSSSQARGKWGERMAEDVLKLAGFTDGINYVKQQKNEAGNKPDFTFTLPKNLKVNMDVKFPLDNYMAYLNAGSQVEIDNFKMEATAAEILKLLSAFGKQWDEYTGCYEKLGEKIEAAKEEFTKLVTTRKNKLDSVVIKIENLREKSHLNLPQEKE